VTHRFERTTCFCLSSIENENKEAAVEQQTDQFPVIKIVTSPTPWNDVQHLWLTTTVFVHYLKYECMILKRNKSQRMKHFV